MDTDSTEKLYSVDGTAVGVHTSHHDITPARSALGTPNSSKESTIGSENGGPPPLTREEFEALPLAIQRKVREILDPVSCRGFSVSFSSPERDLGRLRVSAVGRLPTPKKPFRHASLPHSASQAFGCVSDQLFGCHWSLLHIPSAFNSPRFPEKVLCFKRHAANWESSKAVPHVYPSALPPLDDPMEPRCGTATPLRLHGEWKQNGSWISAAFCAAAGSRFQVPSAASGGGEAQRTVGEILVPTSDGYLNLKKRPNITWQHEHGTAKIIHDTPSLVPVTNGLWAAARRPRPLAVRLSLNSRG